MPCPAFPRDLDVLLVAFSGFNTLLAARATGRAARARYAPERQRVWAAAEPRCWLGRERLRQACQDNDLRQAQWLIRCFVLLTSADLANYDVIMMQEACNRSRLGTAVWVTDRFGLTGKNTNMLRYAMCAACTNGHLPLAIWLADRFGVTAADVRASCNFMLHWSCASGHLIIAVWLVGRFGLTPEDARADNNHTIRDTCVDNHLPGAIWLVDRFGLTAEDVRAVDHDAMKWACARGHLAVAVWLADRFDLALTNAQVADIMHLASRNGHLAIMVWLADRAAPTIENVRVLISRTANPILAEWLVNRFTRRG